MGCCGGRSGGRSRGGRSRIRKPKKKKIVKPAPKKEEDK
jgi:hypothetical protein